MLQNAAPRLHLRQPVLSNKAHLIDSRLYTQIACWMYILIMTTQFACSTNHWTNISSSQSETSMSMYYVCEQQWFWRDFIVHIYNYIMHAFFHIANQMKRLYCPGRCDIPNYGSEDCYGHYTITGEDTRDFCLGWKPGPCPETEVVFKYSSRAWKFISGLYLSPL